MEGLIYILCTENQCKNLASYLNFLVGECSKWHAVRIGYFRQLLEYRFQLEDILNN
jgi:hypothetical protein